MNRKEISEKIFHLGVKNKWLPSLHGSVTSMLMDCASIEDIDIICELINNFTFLTSTEMHETYLRGISHMKIEWELDPNETLLMAVANSSEEPDSSHAMSQGMKATLARGDWTATIRPSMNHLNRDLKKQRYKNIVLIDQFIGTGNTIKGKIKFVNDRVAEVEANEGIKVDYNLYVYSVASMESSRVLIEAAGEAASCDKFSFFSQFELPKGISDSFPADQVADKIDRMLAMESDLDQDPAKYNMVEFPSLGFGQAEALFAIEHENIPNSVFPIFWWKYLNNGSLRQTPFVRYAG